MVIRTVYFDRLRKSGKWTTIVQDGSDVVFAEHPNERAAREFIGLEGGALDPAYQPPAGKTGSETVVDDD